MTRHFRHLVIIWNKKIFNMKTSQEQSSSQRNGWEQVVPVGTATTETQLTDSSGDEWVPEVTGTRIELEQQH